MKHVIKRNCPNCNNKSYQDFISIKRFQFYIDKKMKPQAEVSHVVCENCKFIYMNPVYTKYGFNKFFELAGNSYLPSKPRADEQIKWLFKNKFLSSNSVIMDVGCADGKFLGLIHDKSIKKIGVDIDKHSIDSAKLNFKKHQDFNFICGDLGNFKYDFDPPSIIFMFHVLEHVKNPYLVLKMLKKISSKNTNLVVEIPILEKAIFSDDIVNINTYQHLSVFTKSTFHRLLKNVGWKIVSVLNQKNYNGYRVICKKTKGNKTNINIDSEKVWINKFIEKKFSNINSIQKKISNIKEKNVIICGGGSHTEYLYQYTNLFYLKKILVITDKDEKKKNKNFRGIKILNLSDKIKNKFNMKNVNFIISSYSNTNAIFKELIKLGISKNKITKLYENIESY